MVGKLHLGTYIITHAAELRGGPLAVQEFNDLIFEKTRYHDEQSTEQGSKTRAKYLCNVDVLRTLRC
jgi:hypothetical protein